MLEDKTNLDMADVSDSKDIVIKLKTLHEINNFNFDGLFPNQRQLSEIQEIEGESQPTQNQADNSRNTIENCQRSCSMSSKQNRSLSKSRKRNRKSTEEKPDANVKSRTLSLKSIKHIDVLSHHAPVVQKQIVEMEINNETSSVLNYSSIDQDLSRNIENVCLQPSTILNEEERRAAIEMENTRPYLKPTDLEDIANIFDRIRLLYKQKNDMPALPTAQLTNKSKKLISKCQT